MLCRTYAISYAYVLLRITDTSDVRNGPPQVRVSMSEYELEIPGLLSFPSPHTSTTPPHLIHILVSTTPHLLSVHRHHHLWLVTTPLTITRCQFLIPELLSMLCNCMCIFVFYLGNFPEISTGVGMVPRYKKWYCDTTTEQHHTYCLYTVTITCDLWQPHSPSPDVSSWFLNS